MSSPAEAEVSRPPVGDGPVVVGSGGDVVLLVTGPGTVVAPSPTVVAAAEVSVVVSVVW
ncbi:hypothetical protein [Nannocystis pusilla]|uniref:hypothetical protein n=1 Tax=Nannocystis pusilla TaxID=889268 RepID=UPI003B80FC8D